MSVYVDQLVAARVNPNWRWLQACHLYADMTNELHAFAIKIGLNRTWFQDRPGFPHYDLTRRIRGVAIGAGAIEHTACEMRDWLRVKQARRQARRADPSALVALAMAAMMVE